jgi:hypothetical protein
MESTNILVANCKRMDQTWSTTKIDLNLCITNNDGNLQWKPSGGYGFSSLGCSLNGSTLKCQSKRMNGSLNNAEINLNDLISNLDGDLSCDNNPASRQHSPRPAPIANAPVIEPPKPVLAPPMRPLIGLPPQHLLQPPVIQKPDLHPPFHVPTPPHPPVPLVYKPKYINKRPLRVFKAKDRKYGNGDTLLQNQRLQSNDGKYYVIMQADGNLALYSVKGKNRRTVDNRIWASSSNGKGVAPYRAVLHTDGNLVVYDSKNTALWSSNTSGKGKAPFSIVVQNDGNFVLYGKSGKPTWASNTWMKTK